MARASSLRAILLAGLCCFCLAQERVRIAVVVNPGNPARDISLPALRDFFQCEKLYWRTGERAMVFARQPGSPEHQVMLHAIYSMNQTDYEKLWVIKQMRGETLCRVTELPSKGIVLEGLRAYPGAITLVRESDLTPEMKVLTVNGKNLQDSDYPLQ
jgi:hypothetical protein